MSSINWIRPKQVNAGCEGIVESFGTHGRVRTTIVDYLVVKSSKHVVNDYNEIEGY